MKGYVRLAGVDAALSLPLQPSRVRHGVGAEGFEGAFVLVVKERAVEAGCWSGRSSRPSSPRPDRRKATRSALRPRSAGVPPAVAQCFQPASRAARPVRYRSFSGLRSGAGASGTPALRQAGRRRYGSNFFPEWINIQNFDLPEWRAWAFLTTHGGSGNGGPGNDNEPTTTTQ